MKQQRTRRGFTLIELLVVVLIVGILAAVALPQYQRAVEKSRLAEVWTNLSALHKAASVYELQTQGTGVWESAPTLLTSLDVELPSLTNCEAGSGTRCDTSCPSSGWSNCFYEIGEEGFGVGEGCSSCKRIFHFSKGEKWAYLVVSPKDGSKYCNGSLCTPMGICADGSCTVVN